MDFISDTIGWEAVIVIVIAVVVYFKFIRQKEPDFVIDRNIRVIENLSTKVKKTSKNGSDGPKLTILFYSQTGTAEDFATRLGEDVESTGIPVSVQDVEDYEADKLKTETCVAFLASTYGEGDPPDSGQDFHAWLFDEERESEDFSHVNFTVFGLGNSTYEHFNAIGRSISERLKQLGATSFYYYAEGDDDKNIEDDFLVWKQNFKSSLSPLFPDIDLENASVAIKQKQKIHVHDDDDKELNGIDITNTRIWRFEGNERPNRIVDMNRPYMAKIQVNRELHSESSDRSCRHVEISTHEGLFRYEAGDHVGVYPENDPTLVHKLCSQLNQDPNQIITVLPIDGGKPIIGPCTLKAALLQFYDITYYVKKPMLRLLAQCATDPTEKKRLQLLGEDDPNKQEEYKKEILYSERNVIEVLKVFKSARPPLDQFLEQLPRLQPRYYSISSSSQANPGSIHITAVVVDWVTPTRRQAQGVTTTWFAKHIPDDDGFIRMPVFIRANHNFKLPKNPMTPIIMVGPGTGLAPFRGFIQDRKLLKDKLGEIGETLFFFGCRHPEIDYIYKEELEEYHNNGTIELHTAFSRLTEQKVYVQNLMMEKEMSIRIWKLLEKGACFYLCGDANRLVKDIQSTIVEICKEHGGMDEEEGKKYLKSMVGERYFADVWS